MSNPFSALASVLETRMAQHAGRAVNGITAELGTITAKGLKLDGFKHEIQDYYVADWMAKLHFPQMTLAGSQTGLRDGEGRAVIGTATFTFDPAQVNEVRINWKDGLQPGDRVLAIPVNGGQDAVVLCRIVPGGGG
jgi:hypothetical protein